MDENDIDAETQLLAATGVDRFPDLLTGNIDIIEYLNSGPGSVGGISSDNVFDDDVKGNVTGKMDVTTLLLGGNNSANAGQQQNGHGHLAAPALHARHMNMHMHMNAAVGRPGQGLAPAPIYAQHPHQQQQQLRNSQERPPPYEQHVVRLPDSPPETDSGAGSAGSPSGSETSPYSPEFQHFHHHAVLNGSHLQNSVIHPPVGSGGMQGGQDQQPAAGVILNVHGLDHLTQAVVSDYLPVQTNARVTNHLNGHMAPNTVDYFAVTNAQGGNNGPGPASTPGGAQQTSPTGGAAGASYTPYVLPALHNSYSSDVSLHRKRARTDSVNAQFVKPEPSSPTTHASEESLYYDEALSGHQAIRFSEFQKESWHSLCNINGRELQTLGFAVVADKGFNYSHFDGAFVNQKKNHFQISVHIEVRDPHPPKFVKVPGEGGGLKLISEFQLDFFGVKAEMLSSYVQIKQSQTDRKPICYEPVKLDLPPNRVTKVTVARLHFSETTMNNQRKNGRPNPDQKYFYLVVSLNAVVQGNEKYTIVSYNSERVIVRASNPGQFDNGDSEVHWQKGQTANSIYHPGPVGVGTDKPTSALSVTGDISCTGTVYHPSDSRLKQNIQELNCAEALSKLSQIRIVQYEIRPEIAEQWNLPPSERERVGVIAQEVEQVIPDAVREQGDYLTVDDNRIFYESAAAVKELCRLTGNLEYKIDEVEKLSKKWSKIAQLKRLDSLRSSTSVSSCGSRIASSCPGSYLSCSRNSIVNTPATNRKDKLDRLETKDGEDTKCVGGSERKNRHHHHHHHHHMCRRFSAGDRGVCSNKMIQTAIVILVVVMAFCLLAMATLYILDWHKRNVAPTLISNVAPAKTAPNEGSTTASDSKVGFMAVNITGGPHRPRPPGSGSKDSTTPYYPKLPTLPPVPFPTALPPCVKLSCAEFCCANYALKNSYYEIGSEQHGEPKKENDGTNNDVGRIDVSAIVDGEPMIVLFSRTFNVPSVGESFGDKSEVAQKPNAKSSLSTSSAPSKSVIDSAPRLTKRSSDYRDGLPEEDHPVVLSVLGLNTTIDSRYCLGSGCAYPKRGNLTYYIPISKYMPHIPVQIKFSLDPNQSLQYCWKSTGEYCYGVEKSLKESNSNTQNKNNDQASKSEGAFDVQQRRMDSWELPVGHYQTSAYRFRVGTSASLCQLPSYEAGVSFTEYTLHFYRTCD